MARGLGFTDTGLGFRDQESDIRGQESGVNYVSHWPKNGGVLRGSGRRGFRVRSQESAVRGKD